MRIFHRRSPFSPDRNHIHHLLLDKGFSHKAITLILLTINLLAVGLVYLGRQLGCTLMVFSVLIFFFGIIAIFYYMRPRSMLVVSKSMKHDNLEIKSSKLVPFAKDNLLEQKN